MHKTHAAVLGMAATIAVTACGSGQNMEGVAAGFSDGDAISNKQHDVASPPGRKFIYLQFADAAKALRAGGDIDYEGVSGPIDFDDHGDPTAALCDLFRWRDGKIVVQKQLNAGATR